MNSNKISLILTFFAIILIICIPVIFNIHNEHKDKLYDSTIDKIIIATKKCYLEEKCIESKVTLKELYEFNYLDKVTNPVTKELFNEDSYIERIDDNYKFKKK